VFEAGMVAGISAGIFSGVAPAHATEAPLPPSTIADAARSAGLPCVPAVAVAEAESDGVPDAVGPMHEEGLWQLYPGAWGSLLATGDPSDPYMNARMAGTVLDAQGWAAWSTYGGARYRAALPTARAVCGRHASETSAAQVGAGRHERHTHARTVRVAPGDTLGDLAARLDVPGGARALFDANRDVLTDPDLIHPGDVLTIPRS
jgi:nucleoid-associated protein YgaU